jgi:hypothetical protein
MDWIGGRIRTGRPVAKIELSSEVAGILEGYVQRRKTAQALAAAPRRNLQTVADKQIKRGVHRSVDRLKADIRLHPSPQ